MEYFCLAGTRHNPKTVPSVSGVFPLMWWIFMKVSLVSRTKDFPFHVLVRPCSPYDMKCQAQTIGIRGVFPNLPCTNLHAYLLSGVGVFDFKVFWLYTIRPANAVDMSFSTNLMASRHRNFEGPCRSAGFCLRLGHGAAAPEAKHRCTSQPRPATTPWLSSSSRPMQPWMRRRTTMAFSSEEDLRGKPPEGWDGKDVDEMLICWCFKFLAEMVFIKFWWCTMINMCCSVSGCHWFVFYTSICCWEKGL